ncbi:MAG: amidophosphoribosyltransferase [bacterium]
MGQSRIGMRRIHPVIQPGFASLVICPGNRADLLGAPPKEVAVHIRPDAPDKLRDACGVFGISAPGEDIARLTFLGLFALQHRGQESAGIAVSGGADIAHWKDMGLVQQVFDDRTLGILKGRQAIGHVRYSTTGDSNVNNAQPFVCGMGPFQVALGHNGNLVNAPELREEVLRLGKRPIGTSDTELMALLIQHQWQRAAGTIEDALAAVLHKFRGAYSLVLLTPDKVIGIRDPFGIRPLGLGALDGNFVVASETCAFDIIGATLVREVGAGEMVTLTPGRYEFRRFAEPAAPKNRLCIFEYIYFARPDSYLQGELLVTARQRMGAALAGEHPVDADMVIPVPDSGTPHAIGYAEASGIPYREGLIKNRYVGRTFINPDQRIRALKVKMKLNPLREVVQGQRVVLVDDSIVRGNTSKQIIKMLRGAGAKEIHMRVASPPVYNPCYYGIDTADRDELIANVMDLEKLREWIGADSLAYLSIEGLIGATKSVKSNFCRACLDGDYCVPPEDQLQLENLRGEHVEVPAE